MNFVSELIKKFRLMGLKIHFFVDLCIRNIKVLLCLTLLSAVNKTFIATNHLPKLPSTLCFSVAYQYWLVVDIYKLNESLFLASSLTTEKTSQNRKDQFEQSLLGGTSEAAERLVLSASQICALSSLRGGRRRRSGPRRPCRVHWGLLKTCQEQRW